jgi:hypothetical protein
MQKFLLFGVFFSLYAVPSVAVELVGKVGLEAAVYENSGSFAGQDYEYNLSFVLQPELYWEMESDTVVFRPFLRVDEHDVERTHADIRELSWTHTGDQWEFRSGFRKVFWGVTEFNHLVDIINQTDGVDSFDGEEKLGQPMINASYVSDWGILDAFLLTGFRERTFSGEEGRLRGSAVVDNDSANYESTEKDKHVDYAIRWVHSIGDFDLGTYYFDGTDREPLLQPRSDGSMTVLRPFYQQIEQVGLDVQATIDSWLWKFEAINKKSRVDSYVASQLGFEYTLYGVNESATDIGLLVEHGWDQRGVSASSIAQNDISVGVRLSLNDINDSALLAGINYDADYHSRSLLIEASRRINDHWTLALEGLFFKASSTSDPVFSLREDSRLQLKLERYF